MVKRAVLALLLTTLIVSCGKEEKAEPIKVKTVSNVKTQKVKVLGINEEVSFSGYVIPKREAFVSPKVVGYLIKVNVKAGDRVKKGQVLALIDSSDIKPDVERALAGIREINASLKELDRALREVEARKKAAKANLELAEKTYRRFKNLLEAEAVSKQKFDEVKAQYEAAKANFEAILAKESQIKQKKKVLIAKREEIEAGLKKAEAFLSYTKLKSPFDGFVLKKLVDEGNLVSPKTPVFSLGENPPLVRAFIDDSYFGKLKVGDEVSVVVRGKAYFGKVVEVDRSSDPISHKFGIKIAIKDFNEVPGTYAVVKFPVSQVKALVIPKSAVFRVGAVEYVFVVKDGIAHLRVIKTGETIGDSVVVLSGLHPGEVIAVTNVNNLVDGARIEG